MKASCQNFNGILACNSNVSPVSTTCLCFLSTLPFCSCRYGHDCLNAMPFLSRNALNGLNSPPMSVCNALILNFNWFSIWLLKVMNVLRAWDFVVKGNSQVYLVMSSTKDM